MNIGSMRVFARSPVPVNDDVPHTLSFWRRNTAASYAFDGGEVGKSTFDSMGTVEFGVIMNLRLGFPVSNMQFSGCMLGFDYNGITPLEDTSLPNIVKSPGVISGSCDIAPEPTEAPDNKSTDSNGNDTDGEEEKDKENEDNNETETEGPKEVSENNSTTQTQQQSQGGLGLPFIVLIAAGGFICILLVVYGVSRFAKRRQGVYITNEDKRVEEQQRVEYDKLTMHEEAFELPSKELYM